jgi:hypothetical protein
LGFADILGGTGNLVHVGSLANDGGFIKERWVGGKRNLAKEEGKRGD